MNIAIVGSRTFNNYELMNKILSNYLPNIDAIVSGGARGADLLGERFANENGISTIIFKPDWKKYKKSAGFIRNRLIVENADIIIAFWDGISRGTAHTIELAKKMNKKIIVIEFS